MHSSPHPAHFAEQSSARQPMLKLQLAKSSALQKSIEAEAWRQRQHTTWFNSLAIVEPSQRLRAAACTPQQILACGSTGRGRPVLLASSRLAGKNQFMFCTFASHFSQILAFNLQALRRLRPNPSLKLSTNGVSRWSSGAGPAAHFAPAAHRATPLAPA
jgi:hypothetical protein